MKAVFRCRASVELGIGHVMRCLAVAEDLAQRGWRIAFACDATTLATVPRLVEAGFEIARRPVPGDGRYDVAIIDDYEVGKDLESRWRAHAGFLVVIDDLANRAHDCDLLLDQTPGRSVDDYAALVPERCRMLLGTDYALLRPEFARARPSARAQRARRAGQVETLLVSIGGTDADDTTSLVLEAVRRAGRRLRVDIVLGAAAPRIRAVEAACDRLRAERIEAHLHRDVRDMASLMLSADLAIGAAGSSSWERACLGLASLVIRTADNQALNADALHASEAGHDLGPADALDVDELAHRVDACLSDPDRVARMSERAFGLCSGDGIARLVPHLAGRVDDRVGLRNMQADDAATLYAWQQREESRRYARTPRPPGWEEHTAWFERALADPDRQLFMICDGDRDSGTVRLDRRAGGDGDFEVSILIDPDAHGSGLGSAALRLIRRVEPRKAFWAEILPGNDASLRLFRGQGYQHAHDTWYVQRP